MATILFIPPNNIINTVLALPVLDLFLLDKTFIEVYMPNVEHCKELLECNPFIHFVEKYQDLNNIDYVIDFSRRVFPFRLKGAKGLPFFVPRKDKVLYRHFLKSVAHMVRRSALNYFLSGDFSRDMIWFSKEETEYASFVWNAMRGSYITLVVTGDFWPTHKFADLCLKIVRQSKYSIVLLSNQILDFISSIDKERILDLSSIYAMRYKMSVLAKSRLVVGTALDLTFLSAYLGVPTISIVKNQTISRQYCLWNDFNICLLANRLNVEQLWDQMQDLLSKSIDQRTGQEKEMLWMG